MKSRITGSGMTSKVKVVVTRSRGSSDSCWPISRERKVPETSKLVGKLPMPRTIMRSVSRSKGQRSRSPGRLLLYDICRTRRPIRTSKLVRRWSMRYLPRPAIKACEVGFLHAGGGIPCDLIQRWNVFCLIVMFSEILNLFVITEALCLCFLRLVLCNSFFNNDNICIGHGRVVTSV